MSWWERRLLLQSMVLLPVTALALRFISLRHLGAWFDRPRRTAQAVDSANAGRIAHMVAAAAEYGPYRATCLPQSLVLQYLLRRHGIRGELRYGVRKVNDAITAHCWIEIDGRPLIDSAEVRRHFSVLEPSSAARWGR